jgi:hypothetical protein
MTWQTWIIDGFMLGSLAGISAWITNQIRKGQW